MRSVSCFLPFVPPRVTHNDLEAYMKRVNNKMVAAIRKSDRLKAAEDMMRPYVQRMADGMRCGTLDGAICETVKICWPTNGRHEQGEPMLEKPDIDNWIKTFNDLCERCKVIKDDKLVAELHTKKAWSDPAGVFIKFEEIAW